MKISVLGAGAFGTALAIALASDGREVTLWARDGRAADRMQKTRENQARLPGHKLPASVDVTDAKDRIGDICLLAVPTQKLPALLSDFDTILAQKALVACCKGIDLQTLQGPCETIKGTFPQAGTAMLTGPSFAADIARGLPTALTLACADQALASRLQAALATSSLRLYRTADISGAQLGGALKNVIAIACGACIEAGLGESARAALMTRGFAEMTRLAEALGADPNTLSGLSGLGDLALTCSSPMSRNFRLGQSLARGEVLKGVTVEGASTATAALGVAKAHNIDLPITNVVARLVEGRISVDAALAELLARPQRPE